jgi:prefoldin subunit 5
MSDRCRWCAARVGQCDCHDEHLPAIVERIEELEEQMEEVSEAVDKIADYIQGVQGAMRQRLAEREKEAKKGS